MSNPRRSAGRFFPDEPLYPPPIGDEFRGRPRARTFEEAPPAYRSPDRPNAFPPRSIPYRTRGLAQKPAPGSLNDPQSDFRRAGYPVVSDEERRPYQQPQRYRTPPAPHPKSPERLPPQQWSAPRRAKTVSGVKEPRAGTSPVRRQRYERPSPSPSPSQKRPPSPLPVHEPAARSSYGKKYNGPSRLIDEDADLRRSQTARMRSPPYPYRDGARRRQPQRLPSLDRAGRSRSRRRNRSLSPQPPPRTRHRSLPPRNKIRLPAGMQNIAWQAVAKTALTAGAQAAYKARNDPSPWLGEKGARVATAALGAAIVDGFMGTKYPDRVGGKRHKGFQKAAGLAADRIPMGQTSRKKR